MADEIIPDDLVANPPLGGGYYRPPIRGIGPRLTPQERADPIGDMLRKIRDIVNTNWEKGRADLAAQSAGGLYPGAGGEPTGPATARTPAIGVGGPSPDLSLPKLGRRSPVVINNDTSDVETADVEADPNLSAWPSSGGLPPGAGGEPTGGAIGSSQMAGASGSRDLGELYRQRISGIMQPKGDLTPEQQQRLQQNFFWHLLANNQPGSRFLQGAGQAGAAMSAEDQAQQERNLSRGVQQQKFQHDEAYRAMQLKHQSRLEELQAEKNKIDGSTKEGRARLLEIQAEIARLRAERIAMDPLESSIRTIRKWQNVDPNALKMALSRGQDREGLQAEREFAQVNNERMKMGLPALGRPALEFQNKYGSEISRKSAIYQQILKDPKIGSDTKKADAILQNELGVRLRD